MAETGTAETGDSFCFTLKLDLEPEMSQFLELPIENPFSFGCMWTTIRAGSRFVLLTMSAATSRMSKVIEHSQRVRETWRRYASEIDALVVYIDLEESAIPIIPSGSDLILPDEDTLSFEISHRYSVDLFANYVMSRGVI